MKNLAKFFVAVAALFVGVSCTTDSTEDLAPTVIGKSDFSITVSTGGDVRTSLGEKADDAYPIYWSEGDKLSLNGAASAALPKMDEPTKVATFTWEGLTEEQQTGPFFVLYPASTEANIVTFDATQGYVKGTFQSGSVPMFGYAESVEALENIQLQYLAGVLKIGFWYDLDGSEDEKAPKLERIFIESLDGKPIAGKFNVDKDGNLTPTEDTYTSLYYTPSGQYLSSDASDPTYLHIAVPKGAYETLLLKVISDKGTMIAKIKAGEGSAKGAIVAGEVREFGVALYDTASDGTELIVTEQAHLEELRANPTKYQTVYINEDFTVSDWNTPIEGFAGVVEGNNNTITGLNAPLFGATTAEIKNLHLAEVNINETEATHVGAFARHMTYGGILSNCTVESGTVAYSGTRNDSDPKVIFLGGLVGSVNVASSLIENCTNKATISFPDTASAASILIGGIAGHTVCILNSVKNEGTINAYGTVNGGTNTTHFDGDTENAPLTQYLVGGLVGVSQSGTATACVNEGAVNVGGSVTLLNEVYPSTGFAGCFGAKHSGDIKTSIDNKGKVTVSCNVSDGDKEKNAPVYIAGIVAYGGSSKLNHATNHKEATVTASGTHSYSATADANGNVGATIYYVSGIVARGSNVSGHNSSYLTNNADVICNIVSENVSGAVSGVLNGTHHSTISNVTNSGKITFGANAVAKSLYLGGCCSNWNNVDATGYTNSGDVEFLGKANSLRVGGVCGHAEAEIASSTNTGNITVAGEITNTDGVTSVKVGGVIGHSAVAIGGSLTNGVENDTTKGNITISTTGIPIAAAWPNATHGTCFGGVIGHAQSGAVDNCTNHGSIELTSTISSNPASKDTTVTLGGISGYCGGKVSESTNNGSVTFSGSVAVSKAGLAIAGICARNGKKIGCADCTNNGAITVSGNVKVGISVSGLITLCAGGTYSGLTNNGPITVSGTAPTLNVGGIVSHEAAGDAAVAFDDCKNTANGTITVSGSTYTTLSAGGLAGQVVVSTGTKTARTINNCHNAAAITITKDVTVSTTTRIGGITGYWLPNEATEYIKESTNSGKLEFAGTSTDKLYFGGIVGWSRKGELNTCTNKGEITLSGIAKSAAYVSGVAGTGCNLIKDCWNKANMNVTSTASITGYILLGGVCGSGTYYETVAGTAPASGADDASLVPIEINGGGCDFVDDAKTQKPVIKIEGTVKKTPRIGGVMGYHNGYVSGANCASLLNLTNYADIQYNTVAGSINQSSVGGILGHINGTMVFKNCVNNGDLTVEKDAKYLGGIAASYINGAKYSLADWANLTNNGNIIAKGATQTDGPWFAGILPRTKSTPAVVWKNMHNNGDITVGPNIAVTTYCAGIGNLTSAELSYCSNTGAINVSSVTASTTRAAIMNTSTKKVSNCLISGSIQRKGVETPVTITEENYLTYTFWTAQAEGTANIVDCYATGDFIPEPPTEDTTTEDTTTEE